MSNKRENVHWTDFVEVKKCCASKDIIEKLKGDPRNRENVCKSYLTRDLLLKHIKNAYDSIIKTKPLKNGQGIRRDARASGNGKAKASARQHLAPITPSITTSASRSRIRTSTGAGGGGSSQNPAPRTHPAAGV